ncbi:hypothetical protein [Erythrobacter sp. YT30]|uniref:hypothetical protein n=1 Tax=Erythrobacter sp. YT30 TaxID=1735012 RepID=UPI00076CAFAC|nr:hypothetical protein [Erythrobacter sp. YT30]KWV90745.1 hypothetical protein AUC45_05140 [Erythrobacter sp. YT30]
MASKYGSRRKSGSSRGTLIAALTAFAIGGLLVGYIVWYNMDGPTIAPEQTAAPLADVSADIETPTAVISPTPTGDLAGAIEADNAEEAVQVVTRVAEQQGGLDQRLAAAEQRLARLDLQAEAASGNAARAEALLIAFATRRVIERGAELGYLADQLRLRFGDERPNAVERIITFARSDPPIRLDNLILRLDGLGPQLTQSDSGLTFGTLSREVRNLFVIRRESTPSALPERRLERARFAMEQGRYQAAIDEIKAMPGADKAQAWITDAERFRDVMIALENIETAAVLDQRGLRDSSGELVQQPSPVDASADQ